MILTQNHEARQDDTQAHIAAQSVPAAHAEIDVSPGIIQSLTLQSPLQSYNQVTMHHPRAGLNPVVDAAGHLFTIMGKLQTAKSGGKLASLQSELIGEVNKFQNTIKRHGYNAEYVLVCRYVLCATIDELISNTSWGGLGLWDNLLLLKAYNQDVQHEEKFFSIMERAVKEPAYYIDLMELMYICLSMGYKGHYRGTEHNQYQLEQITSSLYKHIRAYRGNFSKTLSPSPLRIPQPGAKQTNHNPAAPLTIFFFTACIVMAVFIGLGFLMEYISNEAFNSIAEVHSTTARSIPQ